MSSELIRKTDVLDLLNDFYSDFEEYSHLFDDIDFMNPVNAVELPCKAGTAIYVLQRTGRIINETKVLNLRVLEDDVHLYVCGYGYYSSNYIGKVLFFSREEAVRELSKRQGESE